MQVNLARDLRCGMPQQCLHGSYWSTYAIKHRRVAVPQKMPSDHGSRDKSIPVSPLEDNMRAKGFWSYSL